MVIKALALALALAVVADPLATNELERKTRGRVLSVPARVLLLPLLLPPPPAAATAAEVVAFVSVLVFQYQVKTTVCNTTNRHARNAMQKRSQH
jgi:hypothetical protein